MMRQTKLFKVVTTSGIDFYIHADYFHQVPRLAEIVAEHNWRDVVIIAIECVSPFMFVDVDDNGKPV